MQKMPAYIPVYIAYCERQPLGLEEFKEWITDDDVNVSVDSFGGDDKKYQEWLKVEEKATKSQ